MIEEIKKAMAICAKYNVSIFQANQNPLAKEKEMTVEMYDSDTFFAMASDYYRFSGTAYGIKFARDRFDNLLSDEKKPLLQPYIKCAGGVLFYCSIPANAEFEEEQMKLMTRGNGRRR